LRENLPVRSEGHRRYWFKNWEIEVNFQVNGQEYFLAFAEDEGRWYLLAPTPEGARRIPVYVDAASYERVSGASLHLSS